MKKTLMAIMISSSMTFISSANANFSDMSNNLFTSNVELSGVIIDQNPTWVWRIPDTTRQKLTGAKTLRSTGTDKDGILANFDIGIYDLPLLEGFMTVPATIGQLGLVPSITIGETMVDSRCYEQECFSDVAVFRGGKRDGWLRVKYTASAALAAKKEGVVYETQSDLAAQSINAASILSLNQENYSEVYKGARSLDTVVAPTIQWLDDVLNSTSWEEISQSRLITLKSSYIRVFDIQGPWKATLPISVSIQ